MVTSGSKGAGISAATAAGGKDETTLRSSAHHDYLSMAGPCQYNVRSFGSHVVNGKHKPENHKISWMATKRQTQFQWCENVVVNSDVGRISEVHVFNFRRSGEDLRIPIDTQATISLSS